jgi:hypothetical protein
MMPKEQLRAAYARTLAMQTHLSESQRESLLDEYVAQALAPTPAPPPRPVEPDEPDPVSEGPRRVTPPWKSSAPSPANPTPPAKSR